MPLIAPSLLSADFGNLEDEVIRLENAGADLLHLDVMDGRFVPNLTFGPLLIKALRDVTKLPFDVHLMVDEPEKMVSWFAEAGADIITVHIEAADNLKAVLSQIKALGKRAGVSIKPATPADSLKDYLNDLDLILVMTVEPGFGGQSFMEDQLDKIKNIKEMIKDKDIMIEVDGGINRHNASKVNAAGADIIVAGTAVFQTKDYQDNIKMLKD